MNTRDVYLTVLIFYFGWFASVFSAPTQYSYLSLLGPLLLLGFLLFKNQLSAKSFVFALTVSVLGILFDYLLIRFGLIATQGQSIFLMPIWLISIWLLFSFSIIKAVTLLNPPFWVAALLGLIMGPLSYKSGEFFNVLTFTASFTFLIYAGFWALMFPSVLVLSKRFP